MRGPECKMQLGSVLYVLLLSFGDGSLPASQGSCLKTTCGYIHTYTCLCIYIYSLSTQTNRVDLACQHRVLTQASVAVRCSTLLSHVLRAIATSHCRWHGRQPVLRSRCRCRCFDRGCSSPHRETAGPQHGGAASCRRRGPDRVDRMRISSKHPRTKLMKVCLPRHAASLHTHAVATSRVRERQSKR